MRNILLIFLIGAVFLSGRDVGAFTDDGVSEFEPCLEQAFLKEAVAKRQLELMKELVPISEEFDIKRYDIDLEIMPDIEEIAGSVMVTTELVAYAETLWLNMDTAQLHVDSVVGDLTNWEHSDDLLAILLDREYEPGEVIQATVYYHGSPNVEGAVLNNGSIFHEHDGVPIVSTYSLPYGARDWWPCKDQPDDKADTVAISIVAPSELVVASNGSLVSVVELDEQRTKHMWHESYPITTGLVSLTMTNYEVFDEWFVSDAGDSVLVQLYLWPEYITNADTIFALTLPAMEVFDRLFGSYPFGGEKYGHTDCWGSAAFEHQTCTSMKYGFIQERAIVHELAHQWWGNMITQNSFHHVWLNEGFATYSEALCEEAMEGAEAYHNYVGAFYVLYPDNLYVEDPENEAIYRSIVYFKGAFVLHMLRHVVGDSLFFDALLHYRQLFEYSTATTEDFQHAVEDTWGQDLSWFFEQWIYWEYYPYYEYGWTCIERHQRTWLTTVEIRQIQTNTGLFKMPVDLKLSMEDGSEEMHVVWVERTFADSFYFETDSQVTGIELDPDNWVLCEKREVSLEAIDDPAVADAITIEGPWPNPASERTRLIVRPSSPGHVWLYDLGGRLVFSENVRPESHEVVLPLNSDGVLAGTYILRFTSPSGTAHRRLVVRE